MKEKCVILCFIKLHAKVYPKSLGEEWLFGPEARKLIFTHIASCWSGTHEIVEK